MAKMMDVNSGTRFTPSKANPVMQAPSPCAGSGSKDSKPKMMDVNVGGYRESKGKQSEQIGSLAKKDVTY
jgi:hypothetical protein